MNVYPYIALAFVLSITGAAWVSHARGVAEGRADSEQQCQSDNDARVKREQAASIEASETRRADEQKKANDQAAIVAAAEKERDDAIQKVDAVVRAAAADRKQLRQSVRISDGCAAGAGGSPAAAAAGGQQIAGLSESAMRDIFRVGIDADAELRECWGIAKNDRESSP